MIIGIVGAIGSGKSTLAENLVKHGFVEYNIATPLKKICEILGFSPKNLYGTQEEKLELHPYWGVSARYAMQRIGTDLFRNQLKIVAPDWKLTSSTIWVDLLRMRIDEAKKRNENLVVPDVRFPDELELLLQEGAFIVRTIRQCSTDNISNQHISEQAVNNIKVDIEVDNNILTPEQATNSVLECIRNCKK
jgi:GTPase SAR1 family protein